MKAIFTKEVHQTYGVTFECYDVEVVGRRVYGVGAFQRHEHGVDVIAEDGDEFTVSAECLTPMHGVDQLRLQLTSRLLTQLERLRDECHATEKAIAHVAAIGSAKYPAEPVPMIDYDSLGQSPNHTGSHGGA